MREYLHDVIRFSPGVRWFVLSEMMLGLGIGLYTLLLNLHLLAMGLTEAQIGAISSFGTLVMGITAVPCGLMATRLGRKKLLVLGLVMMAAGYAMFGAGLSPEAYYAAQAMQSIGLTLLITTEIQLLFSYSRSKKEETQAFSMLFAVFTLFMGVGTLIGGYLPDWIGGAGSKYQYSIYIAAGFMMAGALARLILLPLETPRVSSTDAVAPGTKAAAACLTPRRRRWPSSGVWMLCGVNLIIGFSFAFLDPFLNIIVKFRLDWSDEATSLLLTLNGISLFLASFLMPLLLERWGLSRTYRIVFLLSGGLALVLAASMPAGLFGMLLLGRGGCFILLNNLILSHSMSALDEEDRNLYAGMRSVFRSIGGSVSTYTAGIVLAGRHYGLPFLFAGLSVIGCYLFFEWKMRPFLVKRLGEREEKTPEEAGA